MKKFIALLMACVLVLSVKAFAITDELILSDTVRNVYNGRSEAANIIENLRFTDVSAGFWAQQVIVKGGALDLVKGYDRRFSPNGNVSKQEALAFILRGIGYETRAVALGTSLAQQYPDMSASNLWSLGYLNYAAQLGIISYADYQASLSEEVIEENTDEPAAFNKLAPATRQEIALWLYRALNVAEPALFNPSQPMQKIFAFKDWQNIDAANTLAVDVIAANGIMVGDDKGNFNPNKSVTRAEMAQVLSNMDSIYFRISGIERKTGTVGAVRDNQYSTTGEAALWRNVYIRTADGGVDILMYMQTVNSSPQSGTADAVVFRENSVSGLAVLEEGDQIEYLVRPEDSSVLYVSVTGAVKTSEVQGKLYKVDIDANSINIKGDGDKQYIYSMIAGLLTNQGEADYLLMDDKRHDVKTLPYGSILKLKLTNNIVTEINFIGQQTLVDEIRGIVVENEPDFGYITVIDNNGNRITKNYYERDLIVEKQAYYDNDDEVGYFNQMFPYFDYDSRNTVISEIEPGDIVFMTISKDDPSAISSISASTNYIMRYGKIKQINTQGDFSTLLLEYENKQTSWFDVANDIFITKDGKLIKNSDIKVGDWGKFLVNEAIIEPGYTIESVKEIIVEGDEHFISSIIKGSLVGINAIQNKIIIEGAQSLSKTGWSNYRDLTELSISGRDIEYYYEGNRISLDYAIKYFKNGDASTYIAMENNYAGEKVKKVTFRTSRDEVLPPDTVFDANGSGSFNILSSAGDISTDSGTIVRRFGRLVDGTDVMPSDYLHVVLNGNGKAAIIDIVDTPDVSQVMVARARVASVKDGASFKVHSVSMLNGTTWVYTPVQREYAIDTKTMFLNDGGYVDPETFMGYTENSVIDRVFNVVTDGSRAAYVIDAPYATRAVRGTIYRIDGDTVSLKDAYVLDNSTNRWNPVSNMNNTITLALQPNSIIAKNNAVVTSRALEIGDQLQIMTNTVPQVPTSGMTINGYIITVEK